MPKKTLAKKALVKAALESIADGVMIIANDPRQTIEFVNPAYERITQNKAQETLGCSFEILRGEKINDVQWHALQLAMQENREGKAVLSGRRKNGDLYWSELSIAPVTHSCQKVEYYVVTLNDISERKALEAQLMHQATHDALTDLPNRFLLEEQIQQVVLHSGRQKKLAAVLFLDFDRFKIINDSLGHKVGDELIKRVSQRLRTLVRKNDTVARIGGNKFVVMLSEIQQDQEADVLAKKLLQVVREPLSIAGRDINITTSIGISVFPRDGKNAGELIRNAEAAMYKAKESGSNSFVYYEPAMNSHFLKVLDIESDLHKALNNKEFEIYYQPVIELATQQIIAVEALIRWRHAKFGLVSPADFICIAEETGLIVPIGEWVIEQACRQCVAWDKKGLPKIDVAVNVSSRQLKSEIILPTVKKVLQKTQLGPQRLILEITESIQVNQMDESIELLRQLRDLGVRLAIDDFGTGYSSLSYLKYFPINHLKIDRAFVRNIISEEDNQAIVIAISTIAKTLNLDVVAEGAETQQEMNFLLQNGCAKMQGYYFSRPIQANACERLIRENRGLKQRNSL